jgi:quinol monooxygenase YgiN
MIIVTLRLRSRKEDTNRIARSIVSLLAPTRVQPGCLGCRLYRDLDDPNTLLLFEEWSAREYLEHHLRSDDFRTVLSAAESSDSEPQLCFYTIGASEGMEVVERVRMGIE